MLVSVMMPTWNNAAFISEAIESILDQTYSEWELIIYDDGSTDGTSHVVEPYLGDARIQYIQGSQHQNCPYARNRCLDHCVGEYIARQDADDICDRRRLERCVNYLDENLDVDIVSTRYDWLLADGQRRWIENIGAINISQYLKNGREGPCCPSIVARIEVYDEIDFDESILAGSDGDWNLRAIKAGYSWGFIDEYLYTQRRHPNQISQRLKKEQRKVHS